MIRIIARAQQLKELEVAVEVDWVPGLMGMEENKGANEAPKTVAETRDIQGCPERFTPMAHIGRTVTKRSERRKNISSGVDTRAAPTYSEQYMT